MSARHLLLPLLCMAVAVSGCAGGGSGAPAGQGGNGGGNTGNVAASTIDTSSCTEVPAALVTALSAKLPGITLSHVFIVKQSDQLFYVSGRMEGPGQAGIDVATFALTSEDPATATISAVGPNAANHSDFPDAGGDVPGSLTDPGAVTSNVCAKTK
jgi:hypothetical protein